jgi:Fatty acid cis/trans isomerase (CTI)
MRHSTLVLIVTLFAGCATLTQDSLDTRFGPADPTRYDRVPEALPGGVSYRRDVKPILDRRCVVCHGCYDAPCQLKLGSWDGIARGATAAPVYGDLRLNAVTPTRLGIDAQLPSVWRQRGFHSVLNERRATPANELAASLIFRSLAHKQAHGFQVGGVLPETYDFSLDRSNRCTPLADYDSWQAAQPQAGMPYGLPALNAQELNTVTRWLQAGAPDDAPAPLPAAIATQVAQWETFLNGRSAKQRLMSRYLYEHLFLGHLRFEGDTQRHVFRLVRSATPPGQAIRELATRRPFDDPGPDLHYRLRPETETIVAKSHMPFVLSAQRMARWRAWFLDRPYTVEQLPAYAIEQASNPFTTFAAIPLDSRYRFLLDDAQFFVMNFIKGPVCRGQTALDVINDRFWVFFIDPAVGADEASAQMVAREAEVLRLPAAEGSNARVLTSWRALAASEDAFLAAKSAALNRRYGGEKTVDLSLVWRGDSHNPNAALTIFRHFDSASVVQGLVGEAPKTAWLIGYPLLERIYYLLVAGYDVWGNTAHQLETRLFMDYLRMEGEANLLMLLPRAARLPLRDHWYRGVDEEVKSRVAGSRFRFDGESGIRYAGSDPMQNLQQLYGLLHGHLAPALNRRHELALETDGALRTGLQQLAAVRGAALAWFPEAAVLRIDTPGRPARYFSVLRQTGHLNVSTLLRESAMLAPAENALTVVPGFVGAYPNAILHSTVEQLPALARQVAALTSEADYRALADRHALRRTDPGFWAASDALHEAYQRWSPAEAGLLDYGRLENR